MKNFLIILEPIYIVLSRRTLSTRILNDFYEEIKKEIEKILRRLKFWNISVNKSANITKDPIINFCSFISSGPFYIKY
jgi:hypothetical protein